MKRNMPSDGKSLFWAKKNTQAKVARGKKSGKENHTSKFLA